MRVYSKRKMNFDYFHYLGRFHDGKILEGHLVLVALTCVVRVIDLEYETSENGKLYRNRTNAGTRTYHGVFAEKSSWIHIARGNTLQNFFTAHVRSVCTIFIIQSFEMRTGEKKQVQRATRVSAVRCAVRRLYYKPPSKRVYIYIIFIKQ